MKKIKHSARMTKGTSKKYMKVMLAILALAVVGVLGVYGVRWYRARVAAPPLPLRILWFKTAFADSLEKTVKKFTEETGIPVILDQVSVVDWAPISYQEVQSGHPRFDLLGGDSQWLGYMAEHGYYEELTQFIKDNHIEGLYVEGAMKAYCEYPDGSERYFAAPFNADIAGYAYRKDWFEDPKEQADFLERYGYPLAVPKTYVQLRDIAEFFYRPDEGKYGIVLPTGGSYDAVTIGFGSFLFGYGGGWGDRSTCEVNGMLTNPGAVEALELMRELYGFAPPGTDNLAYTDVRNAFYEKNAAIMDNVLTLATDVPPQEESERASYTGYFGTLFGPKSRYGSVSGQGISLVKGARNRDAAIKFLNWWVQADTQAEYVRNGGFTMHRHTLATEEFLNASPYNEAYATSLQYIKDFWNGPHYQELLAISQKYLHAYVVGETDLTAQQTLDAIVREWGPILATECDFNLP